MSSKITIEEVIKIIEEAPRHFEEFSNADIDIAQKSIQYFEEQRKKINKSSVFWKPVFLGYDQNILNAHFISIYSLFETLLQHTCMLIRTHKSHELRHTELRGSYFQSCIRFLSICVGFEKASIKSHSDTLNAYRYFRNKQLHQSGYLNLDIELGGKKIEEIKEIKTLKALNFNLRENTGTQSVSLEIIDIETLKILRAHLSVLFCDISNEIVEKMSV